MITIIILASLFLTGCREDKNQETNTPKEVVLNYWSDIKNGNNSDALNRSDLKFNKTIYEARMSLNKSSNNQNYTLTNLTIKSKEDLKKT